MKTHISMIALTMVSVGILAADLLPTSYSDNLLEAVRNPSEQQNVFIKQEAAKLAKSQVPTAELAVNLAVNAYLKKPGLDAQETLPKVTGLFRVGRDVADFAKAGDLFWEIRITRSSEGVSGVIWVSTTTKSVKVLFP